MTLYKHPDRKHYYYDVSLKAASAKFVLCQVGGSLSSIISFEDKAEASTQGWYVADIHKAWVVLDHNNKAIAYLDDSLGVSLEASKQYHAREGYKIVELQGEI